MTYWVIVAVVLAVVVAAMVGLALIPIRMGRREGRRLWPWFLICIPFPYAYPVVWAVTFIVARGKPKGQPIPPIDADTPSEPGR